MTDTISNVTGDENLHLRAMADADFPQIIQQLNDPQVIPWLAAIAHPFGLDDAKELQFFGEQDGMFLRVLVHRDQIAGCLCLGAATWYWLDPELWGQGLMCQAMSQALASYFTRPAPPLIASCRTDNTASQALLTRLGFSCSPHMRRMFFRTEMKAHPCHDYVLTPEQWHLLNPSELQAGSATLRPATQKDVQQLSAILPLHAPWPGSGELPGFIECHRFRGTDAGLFVISDGNQQIVGTALLKAHSDIALHFVDTAAETKWSRDVRISLRHRFTANEG